MASKKYKGKTCVYCAVAVSETADHIVCRMFFPDRFRDNLPKAPACRVCNAQKSEIEHYLTAVLPFGSGHETALLGQPDAVERRLENNEALRKKLVDGASRVRIRSGSGENSEMSGLPLDREKYSEYLELVVRGLVWHEWQAVIPPDYIVQVISMTARKFTNFGKATFFL